MAILAAEDVLAIHELVSLYGIIIDEREFERIHELFTTDAVYDMSDFGRGIVHGRDAIRALWESPDATHPLAHHATNIVVRRDPDGTVRVISKGLGLRPNNQVGSVTYRDVVIRTETGWRMSHRSAHKVRG